MMDWAILESIMPRKMRPWLLRRIGCHVGKNVFIGDFVRVDLQHAHMIYIDNYAHVTSDCRLLCHQRYLTNYRVGDNAVLCGYITGEIHICKGCMIGMRSMIMSGVTIGDGLIVGANSLVTKNIPLDIIATRMATKVVKAAERETIIGEQQN